MISYQSATELKILFGALCLLRLSYWWNLYTASWVEFFSKKEISKKSWKSRKRSIFLSLISESEIHILYRFITHRVKYFKPLFLNILILHFDDYGLQTMKTQNLASQKIRILHKIIKKDILKRNVRLLKSMLIYMHSILGWASFCMNYCINYLKRGLWITEQQSSSFSP